MQVLETLTYIGRNRRFDECVIEKLIELDTDECEAISARSRDYDRQLRFVLQSNGIPLSPGTLSNDITPAEAVGFFSSLYANTALAIQQAAGHKVTFATTINDPNPNRKRVVFEYEQEDVGHRADLLVLDLLASVIPELNWTDRPQDQARNFAELFVEFKEFAHPLILPADTRAIINAATQLDVPCVKLDRTPYQGVSGDFRIRINGLLKLGHSAYQHIVDGTLCIDKGQHLLPLLKDREQLFQVLTQLQVPVARQDSEFRNCVNARRAVHSAASIGFPVAVKPWLRSDDQSISLNITDADALRSAVDKAQRHNRKVMVEKHVAGETFKIIVANEEVIGVLSAIDGRDVFNKTHPSTLQLVQKLAGELNAGMLVVDVVTTEIDEPLRQNGGAVVDVELAPELDRFLAAEPEILKRAMSSFVKWLYPPGEQSRIPLVAVTGTNGKTTTSRMITSIMRAGGFHTGLACTDGLYINNKLTDKNNQSGSVGHHRVLESREVNLGVLETARGALANSGFMFDWCNVSVCLNVDEDHLGQYGIETVQQMAELKRSVLESARDAVVLNADDKNCIGMLPFNFATRICLVSLQAGVEELAKIRGNASCFSILESIDGSDWLVLYDGGQRMPVIEAALVPATYGGLAHFNTSNALHAIAACYLMNIDLETIKEGMRTFGMSVENTPGRLNEFAGFPFKVIVDTAHNVHGFRAFIEFTNRLPIKGKKIVNFGASGRMRDEDLLEFARLAARNFDLYVLRNYRMDRQLNPEHRSCEEILEILRKDLIFQGVPEEKIIVEPDVLESLDKSLEAAQKGDVLLVLVRVGGDEKLEVIRRIEEAAKELALAG